MTISVHRHEGAANDWIFISGGNFSFNVELNCHHNRLQIPLSSLIKHKWVSQRRVGRLQRYYGTTCYWKPQELNFYWMFKRREKMKCHEDFCFVMAVMIVVSSAPSPLTTALLLHLIESEPCDSSDTPPSVSCPPSSWSLITLLCVREHHWRNVNVAPDVLALLLIVAAAPEGLSHGDQGSSPLSSQPCPLGPTMISTESVLESGDQPCIALEPLKNTHLPGKATPAGGGCAALADGNPKVTANGVHDIEDRILRITGYYGYNPGYSSHRSEWKEKKNNKVCWWDHEGGCDSVTAASARCEIASVKGSRILSW